MFIYLLLLIPIIFTIVMFFKFKHEVVWWEYLISFGVTIICIFASKAIIQKIQVSDTEYWGGWVKEVRYYEDWNEYIHQTCECCCDKDGNNCSTYDCSYVQYHSEYYRLLGSNGEDVSISKSEYERLVSKFGVPEKFVDLHRNYHTNDGDMYKAIWSGTDNTLEPVISRHVYDNRPRVSSSTYAQAEPSKEIFKEYELFHYPDINGGFKQPVILGYDDPEAETAFQLLNAKYGSKYQFKTYVMIFKGHGREAGLYQEQQWQGGNKNELNITIGIDSLGNVKWCHVFSWTEKLDIVVETRELVYNQGVLNLLEISDYLTKNVPTKWERKEFTDFSYLTVEPRWWHILISFIITFGINVGIAIFVISNEFTENGRKSRDHRTSRNFDRYKNYRRYR
jgi:hypothetical protein